MDVGLGSFGSDISIHAPRTGSDRSPKPATGSFPISIHAPRTGSDAQFLRSAGVRVYFNPRSPHGERLLHNASQRGNLLISIHAPRTGSDGNRRKTAPSPDDFNPRSPHGERPRQRVTPPNAKGISIHAPRTGSDFACGSKNAAQTDFNPRSPHGERPGLNGRMVEAEKFQSTLPARGATRKSSYICICGRFQSTLPARGATIGAGTIVRPLTISIHAPRTGSDDCSFCLTPIR